MQDKMATPRVNLERDLTSSGNFFKDFATAITKGDLFVKLSLVWWGAGYARRKQYFKAVVMTLLEIAVIWFTLTFAVQYVPKFPTLGTVQAEQTFNPATMKTEWNNYDDSFQILLYSVLSFVIWFVSLAIMLKNTTNAYMLQRRAELGLHINTFKEDVESYLDEKFHITLLSLPVLGVVLFNVIPLFILILVAFTNYDQQHMPPTALFTWTGLTNFVNLLGGGGLTVTFGYSFARVLAWTLVWAVFATFTTYIGGILLSLFLNNKRTKLPKLWRALFIVTIAVPQFVSLLLVRNFFADNGIFNGMLTSAAQFFGLIDPGTTLNFRWLTAPGWAHVTIIIINIWIGVPYQMLIATGVLTNLPVDQIESAHIDGANATQTFCHITMPYVLFVTGPALVTDFVKNINNFNVIYLLTQGVYTTTNQALANSQATEVDLLITWLFRLTQDYYNYKMASVIGIAVFVLCSLFTLIAFNFMIKGDKEGVYN